MVTRKVSWGIAPKMERPFLRKGREDLLLPSYGCWVRILRRWPSEQLLIGREEGIS
jgi:hypothetical protein